MKHAAYEFAKLVCSRTPLGAGVHLCNGSPESQAAAVYHIKSVFYLLEIFLGDIVPPPEPHRIQSNDDVDLST